ncbi:ATP-dependent DNA helicase II subunit 2 [Teratosphaeria destructans]|uniref:ATP-dependent DNA helicase II subunit 2 n=1 Tax=Teratosphaeria destructans TaxID=418781 RepID=A0A9W7SRJ0_9PEZI|nr:ATP-dependent DNA helicase II subunit 2 [Teratosphaeria destructans]
MANKEATVYIVDCGSTMGEKSHGREQTNLEWSLEYIWDEICATIATGRKTILSGVVGFRTDVTTNSLAEDDAYANISVFQDLGQILMPQLRKIRSDLVVSSTEAGDALSALVIAIQMIAETCKKLKYDRKIVLLTDGRGSLDVDDLPQIVKKMREDSIELIVLGVDFDDAEYGFKEEGKDGAKAENEEILRQLCEDCNGVFGTVAQAVDELQTPRIKSVRPTPLYKGLLTLGNPEQYDDAISIDVERYPKTMKASALSSSQFVVRSDMAATQATTQTIDGEEAPTGSADGLAAVKNARSYQVQDEHAPGGKRDVDRDELSKGYAYGSTAVHISDSDQNVTTYETMPGFDIVGFVEREKYERYFDMSRASMTVSMRNNDQASMGLSSLINALWELDSYAVARLVKKENNEPRLLLIAPNVEPDFECLYDVELPFQEDLRQYKFPPLDRVVTVSGKMLKVHRNLPSDDLKKAMSDYVDSMDLSTFGKVDEGKATEYAPPDETVNPIIHRINQVIKHRAVNPDADPPEPYELLTRYSRPPDELVEKAEPALHRVRESAQVKKVPPKARGRFGKRKDAPKPLSDLDVNALLAQDPKRKARRIDPRNAIPEFKQLILSAGDEGGDEEALLDAVKQFKTIIFDWIKNSVGDSAYQRVVEAVGIVRDEAMDISMPALYNAFAKELKEKVLKEELGGDRKELWHRIRSNRLGLLSGIESEGGASEDEAKAFMSSRL